MQDNIKTIITIAVEEINIGKESGAINEEVNMKVEDPEEEETEPREEAYFSRI